MNAKTSKQMIGDKYIDEQGWILPSFNGPVVVGLLSFNFRMLL
jgi:hypothetical protein